MVVVHLQASGLLSLGITQPEKGLSLANEAYDVQASYNIKNIIIWVINVPTAPGNCTILCPQLCKFIQLSSIGLKSAVFCWGPDRHMRNWVFFTFPRCS